jgi:hypothetical protein
MCLSAAVLELSCSCIICLLLWAQKRADAEDAVCLNDQDDSSQNPNVSHAGVCRREVRIIPVVVQPGWLLLLQAPGHPQPFLHRHKSCDKSIPWLA